MLHLIFVAALAAAAPDHRLATAHTAAVVAGDPLADDQPIAACFADHLTTATPLQLAPAPEADVVLIVRGDLHNALVQLRVEAGGEKLWFVSTSLSRGRAADRACDLADAALTKLRDGMRQARDRK